ncbi:MAG: barstar family protein [Planctomycetia bacterium]|nr:barstar family protein [Planctomycetia bacterium]
MIQYYHDFPEDYLVDSLNVVMGLKPASKEDFLTFAGQKLGFPDWYGRNWDAFEECLSDLSWIRQRTIRLVFPVLPLSDMNELKTFLDILRSAQVSLADFGIELQAIFSDKDREVLENL